MLEPTALLTAMPPLPCLATIADETISGTEVPIPKTINAITISGTPKIAETCTALSTNTQQVAAIRRMEIVKTKMYFSGLGTINLMVASMGLKIDFQPPFGSFSSA